MAERTWAVAYSRNYAVAVVMADSKRAITTPAQIIRSVAGHVRSRS